VADRLIGFPAEIVQKPSVVCLPFLLLPLPRDFPTPAVRNSKVSIARWQEDVLASDGRLQATRRAPRYARSALVALR
jgi:hypothetical protein